MEKVFNRVSDFYLKDWRSRSVHFVLIFFASVVYSTIMDVVFHRPSDRVAFECVALVASLMIVLPVLTVTRQWRDKPSRISTAVYQAVRAVNAKLDEATSAGGLQVQVGTANSELAQENGDHAVEALGKVLTETARRLERFKENEAKWRPMFLSIIRQVADEYEDQQIAYRILLRSADKNRWPGWAVRCLPSLYDTVQTDRDGSVVAHVSQYVLGGLSPSYQYRALEKLCDGEILKVAMPTETAKRVQHIAAELAVSLQRNPNESDRAFIGTIITLWSQNEKISAHAHDSKASQKLKMEREKVLAEESVMTAHGV